jgi:hypothetical protein
MAIDYDIARAIIDELLPYSLEYYLGVRGGTGTSIGALDKDKEGHEDEVAIYYYQIFLLCFYIFARIKQGQIKKAKTEIRTRSRKLISMSAINND